MIAVYRTGVIEIKIKKLTFVKSWKSLIIYSNVKNDKNRKITVFHNGSNIKISLFIYLLYDSVCY